MKFCKWFAALAGILSAVALSNASWAANIAWVSFHSADNMPSAGAVGQGFTEAPDKGYTDFLTANGHTVTRVVTSGTPNTATLNTFDVVMISRSVPSGDYELDAETVAWNGITSPTILMGGYILRSSRLGYTTGTTIPDAGGAGNPTGVVRLQVTNPAHPIFAGIALDGTNTMVNPYNTALPTAGSQAQVQRGISVNTNPLAGGGVLLATINTAGDAANAGTMIAKWSPGATMGTTPADILGGHRLVFLSGTREHAANAAAMPPVTTSGDIAGIFDLDADGRQMLLNAVNYMDAIPEPATPTLALLGMAGVGMLRRKARLS